MKNAEWENWVNLILGVWLFFSPWILPHSALSVGSSAADWNFWIIGAIVAVSSALALQDIKPWEEWLNLVLGVWLFISPFVLGFARQANLLWNALIVGVIVVVLSAVAIPIAQKRVHVRVP